MGSTIFNESETGFLGSRTNAFDFNETLFIETLRLALQQPASQNEYSLLFWPLFVCVVVLAGLIAVTLMFNAHIIVQTFGRVIVKIGEVVCELLDLVPPIMVSIYTCPAAWAPFSNSFLQSLFTFLVSRSRWYLTLIACIVPRSRNSCTAALKRIDKAKFGNDILIPLCL